MITGLKGYFLALITNADTPLQPIVERGGGLRSIMSISAEEILAEIGPVQEVLDAHDGVVTVLDTSDGNIMLSLDGGCTGCSSTPMTAMQIYYSLKKLDSLPPNAK